MTEMQFHPVSELFPGMPAPEFEALVADIAHNGLREPIHVMGETVIDGRHRYRACQAAGVEPRYVEVDENTDVYALVISLNLHRRHLSDSQRAMVAARLETLGHGQRAATARDANLHVCTREEAAQKLAVSTRSVANAAKVRAEGVSELVAAVDRGDIAVSTAADIARLPADEQRAVLAKTQDEIRAIAHDVKSRIDQAGVCGKSAVRIFDQVAADQHLSGIEQCAVVEVINAENTPLPTPSEAKRIAQQKNVLVLGSDGRYHGPEVSAESAASTERWLALREGLESLCRIDTDPTSLMACVPHYQHKNLCAWLAQAVPLITRFDQVWKGAHHA